MSIYKTHWDATTKKASLPIGDDTTGRCVVLTLDSKEIQAVTEYDISDGIYYAYLKGDTHWLVGTAPQLFYQHTNKFFKQKEGEKWVDIPGLEQSFIDALETTKGLTALCVNGEPTLEAMVKAWSGKWFVGGFKFKRATSDTELKALLEADGEGVEDILTDTVIFIPTADDIPSNAKGKKFPHAPYGEDFTPLVLPLLPAIKASSNNGYGRSQGMTPAQRLAKVVELLSNPLLDTLALEFAKNPFKVNLALSLAEGTPLAIPDSFSYTAPPEEKHYYKHIEVIIAKEYKEEQVEQYSQDAIDAIKDTTSNMYFDTLDKLASLTLDGCHLPDAKAKKKLGISGSVFKLSLSALDTLYTNATTSEL